jgi:Phytanoyl-CoA dioxygenase (PhyH)
MQTEPQLDVVTEEQRYLFDLNGYVVLRSVLTSDELAELNELIDENDPPAPGETLASQRFGGFLQWGPQFRDLLCHPRLLPLLLEWVDPAVRLDRYYAIHMRAGTSGLPLHGGAQEIDDGSEYFLFRNGEMQNGITTAIWALSDMLGGQGGFVCIPGSHKSNYPRPESYDYTSDCVVHVELNAGDVLVFTGALAHGTHPWTAPHERRSLVFKYAPGHVAWGRAYLEWPAELREQLTPRQAALLEPPYVYQREELEPGYRDREQHVDPTADYTA